jgi:hypothetical protein
MKYKIIPGLVACLAASLYSATAGDVSTDAKDGKEAAKIETPAQKISTDIFSIESNYTGQSTIRRAGPEGKQDQWYNDFSYAHRFHTNGNWYLSAGIEYQRYDFGGNTYAPQLPEHLQAAQIVLSYQYVVQDFAAVAFEVRPGFFFENDVQMRNFSVPFDLYASFPIVKDKVFGMVGAFSGQFFSPPVTPLGGVIWLINDKMRLEAIFPRPALIYNLSENWEARAGLELGGYGFRVDKDGRTPAEYSGSVLMYKYYQVGVGLKYTGFKPFNIFGGAGYTFEREFDYFRNGPGQKFKAAGAPYIKIGLEAKF